MSPDAHRHHRTTGAVPDSGTGTGKLSWPIATPQRDRLSRRRPRVSVPVPTTQRRSILAALAENPAFVSAQALHAQLVAAGPRVGLTTVYRALHTYAATGDIDTTRAADGTELFRHRPEPGHPANHT